MSMVKGKASVAKGLSVEVTGVISQASMKKGVEVFHELFSLKFQAAFSGHENSLDLWFPIWRAGAWRVTQDIADFAEGFCCANPLRC